MYLYSLQSIGGAKYEARPQEIGKKKRKKEENKLTRRGIIQSSNELPGIEPSDLQSDALPPELSRRLSLQCNKSKENKSENRKKQLLSLTVWEPRLWKRKAATSQSKSNNKAKKKKIGLSLAPQVGTIQLV